MHCRDSPFRDPNLCDQGAMMSRTTLPACLAVAFLGGSLLPVHAADDPKGIELFETKIRPVLVASCYECHSAKATKLKGGLLLDSRDGILQGGDNGPAVVPGKPAESLLLKSIKHDKLKMPPAKPLPAHVIADFERWIAIGAPDPRTSVQTSYKKLSMEEAKSFWSFLPVRNAPAPKVADSRWAKNDADRFVLAALEAKKLKPVDDADRETLIRRIYFDLIGLPPSVADLDAALADSSPRAIESLIDKLLASPQFGERWGRYWLDIARYAESNGNADNLPFPEAWRYRDYVIKATNEDRPYDRFIKEQIAGDLLPSSTPAMKDELLIATSLMALTSKPRAQNNPDYKYDLIGDQIDVASRSVLSMSVMCARCHDHKFDPISTKEYYSLAGIFESSQMMFGNSGKNYKGSGATALHELSDGGKAMGLRDGTAKNSQVCIGGDSTKLGETVPRAGFLKVGTLASGTTPEPVKTGSGRLELAEWMTSKDNPLTARVAVNRIWLHLFGQGIVKSADNFGFLGERPSHPELLDHLATKFMADGWSQKAMIRYLVLSRTYQLSSAHDATAYKADPDNILRWRMGQRRLDAEAFRDALLSVSGRLDLTPVKGSKASAGGKKGAAGASGETANRSIYLGIVRGAPLPESLSLFDVANPHIVTAQREETTVPAQALYLMNSPFVVEQARSTTTRLLALKDLDDAGRIDHAYRLLYSRPASSQDKERALKYLTDAKADFAKPADLWASLVQAMLASAEFRYIR